MSDTVEVLMEEEPHFDEVIRLSRDLLNATRTMGDEEARYLVDAYYMMQESRKRTANQVRSLTGEPNIIITWLTDKNRTLERQVARALDSYTQHHVMGSWMREVRGIGPVLAAGLLAHLYMGMWCQFCRGKSPDDCQRRQENKRLKLEPHEFTPVESIPTVGHIWQFAGIAGDGQRPWEKGQKRPFNGALKTLCWKVGQSFMKMSNHPACFYGHIYRERKALEIARNERGDFKEQAAKALPRFNKTTEAYKHYAEGKLPPAHIDARARRYAVKLFLAHLHDEWYERVFDKAPPLPYPIAHLGHAHVIKSPY